MYKSFGKKEIVNNITYRVCVPLKLDLYDKNKPTNKLKIKILSKTSIPYLIRRASFILIVGLHL